MKQFAFLLTFLWICVSSFAQNSQQFVCRLGFTYEMSQQPSWGYNKPVVLSVTPLSPADAAGIEINDIIETINDAPTENQTLETITNWLQDNTKDEIKLTVNNLKQNKKNVSLFRDCKLSNGVNEKDMASSFAFYSLEDVQARAFTCPFKTTLNPNTHLKNYKTFGFSPVDENNRQLEEIINKEIRAALESKGLAYSENNPDLIIQTYYSYNKNLNYTPSENMDKFPVECRYNMQTGTMENLPIYYNPLINNKHAQFLLNLGVRLIDNALSSGENLFVVWECEANELLQSDYPLEKYAQFHLSLMFMQYPYPQTLETAHFYLSSMKYNYTGIYYNMNNLKEIADIDRFSPAYKAELEPGDIIEKINGIKYNSNSEDVSNSYKQFIFKTMNLRDNTTQFTNAEGFTKCMYWNKMQYAQVAEAFKKPENSTAYSYLFYFEPYINLSGTNIVTFSIQRNKQKMDIKVTPTIKTEKVFENYRK